MPIKPVMIGLAAHSGTGKTSLLEQLIRLFREKDIRIGVIKHSHHDFEIDRPGKDSYRLHHAGSSQTLLISKYRSAVIREQQPVAEVSLQQAMARLDLNGIDLVMVEGFRHEDSLPRIELHRPALGQPLLYPQHNNIIAVASDVEIACDIPLLDLNNAMQIADFILQYYPQLKNTDQTKNASNLKA